MQHRGAVAVERALRIACGSRRIAERCGRPLVELRPLEVVFLVRKQPFIARKRRQAGLRLVLLVGHQDYPAIRRQARSQPLEQREKGRVDEQKPVCGMVYDVHDLLIEQPRVDRVTNGANARDAVIKLEMAEGIPAQECPPGRRA